MPARVSLFAVLLISTFVACHPKAPLHYGGTYAYGDPQGEPGGCGKLEVYPENDTTLLFHLYINRGAPSYNNGEIEGRIVVRGNKASFGRQFDFSETECMLEFEFYEDSVRIAMPGEICACGFGYGVYADGIYGRTSREIPQFYTTVAGDTIRFEGWQEPVEELSGSRYARIDNRFIDCFPDYKPGTPFQRGKLLPDQVVMDFLSDQLVEGDPWIYAIGRIMGYRGLNLFVCELDYTRPDEESYDNHMEGNIYVLAYDQKGFAVEIDSQTGEAERAMHQLCAHYYGEGGEWTLESSFAADTTIISTYTQSESESATGYQTPFNRSHNRRSVILPLGQMETLETTEQHYSSPFYNCRFLAAQDWAEVAEEGFNGVFPTRNSSWELIAKGEGNCPVNVFFHIERLDGRLTPVFTTSQSDETQLLSRYVVGHPSVEAEAKSDTTPAPTAVLISTSDGDLEVCPDGKLLLHRR